MFDQRTLRLLAQYSEHYFCQALIDRTEPPHELYDMTTYRLENLDNLEEVIDSVLEGGEGVLETLASWQRLKRGLTSLREHWEAGQKAYNDTLASYRTEYEQERIGMDMARSWSGNEEEQMWFYEGWLVARDREE